MTDRVPAAVRSQIMRRVGAKNSKLELVVRRLVHSLGYRYRLHRRDLPGTPDLVFIAKRKVIFVHGCFWHQHNCPRAARPKSNTSFWNPKLRRNVERDRRNVADLVDMGWEVMTIWECETKVLEALSRRIVRFLG